MGNRYVFTEEGYGIAQLNKGGVLLFDAVDLPLIQAHTWYLGTRGYAVAHIGRRTVVLHRLLFPDVVGEIDHVNGDKLDNRRRNLRIVTHQQNAFNQRLGQRNTSGFIGVCPDRRRSGFEAYIHHGGKKHHIGMFRDACQAALARDAAAEILFGEYARLNFPRERILYG